jgi:predicted PurR-regulated permease PerM
VQAERTIERIVSFRPRTILSVLAVLLTVGITLWVLWIARHVLTWVLISLFLALALNPLVDWLQAHGIRRRSLATTVAYIAAAAIVAGIAYAFIPTLVHQVNHFANKVPDYIDQLTKGRGRLGFLETKYHIVEKVRHAVQTGGVGKFTVGAAAAISVTKSVLTGVAATVTIVFMTFFMVLEGPAWMERLYGLFPEASQPRWRRVGHDIYLTVGGYVTGNLLISVIAGTASAIVLFALGVPYSVALGLLVGILDLIPLAGATLAAIIVVAVAAITQGTTAAIIVTVFFIVYQQLENHLLQPVVYGRTVQLSPLAVLIAVLIGAEVAGILGALGAIPIAGAIQVIVVDWQRERRERRVLTPAAADAPSGE